MHRQRTTPIASRERARLPLMLDASWLAWSAIDCLSNCTSPATCSAKTPSVQECCANTSSRLPQIAPNTMHLYAVIRGSGWYAPAKSPSTLQSRACAAAWIHLACTCATILQTTFFCQSSAASKKCPTLHRDLGCRAQHKWPWMQV